MANKSQAARQSSNSISSDLLGDLGLPDEDAGSTSAAESKASQSPADRAAALAAEAKATGRALPDRPSSAAKQDLQTVLPFWPDAVRAIPNDVARSAIFTARSFKVKRVAFRDSPVFTVSSDVRLSFTGVELRAADDELVWQQLLHYARAVGPDNWIECSANMLCRDLGWPVNQRYRTRVRQSLLTLSAASIFVERPNERGRLVRFVNEFVYKREDGEPLPRWRVKLGRELAIWFAGRQYTQLEFSAYRQLDPIARRLADYICSHAAPYSLKLETVRQMCGSDTKSARRFRDQVRSALAQLVEHGFVTQYEIDGTDLVSIVRASTN